MLSEAFAMRARVQRDGGKICAAVAAVLFFVYCTSLAIVPAIV